MKLSSVFGKKVGDYNKRRSESLVFTGLEIISFTKGELLWNFLNNVKHVNLIFLEYVWGMEILYKYGEAIINDTLYCDDWSASFDYFSEITKNAPWYIKEPYRGL
ncbi:MAG: hypothetical protein ACLUZ6_05720 [Lachnospira eligens]